MPNQCPYPFKCPTPLTKIPVKVLWIRTFLCTSMVHGKYFWNIIGHVPLFRLNSILLLISHTSCKNSVQTSARGGLELAVSCEHLLHIEGLIVTLIWRTAIKALFLCLEFCQVHARIFCYEYIHHIPSFLLHTHKKKPKSPLFFNKKRGKRVFVYHVCCLFPPPSSKGDI